MGNSTGMIVPKAILEELGLAAGRALDVRVVNREIVVKPEATHPRAGWEEAAKAIADEPLDYDWLDAPNDFDDEWEW